MEDEALNAECGSVDCRCASFQCSLGNEMEHPSMLRCLESNPSLLASPWTWAQACLFLFIPGPQCLLLIRHSVFSEWMMDSGWTPGGQWILWELMRTTSYALLIHSGLSFPFGGCLQKLAWLDGRMVPVGSTAVVARAVWQWHTCVRVCSGVGYLASWGSEDILFMIKPWYWERPHVDSC